MKIRIGEAPLRREVVVRVSPAIGASVLELSAGRMFTSGNKNILVPPEDSCSMFDQVVKWLWDQPSVANSSCRAPDFLMGIGMTALCLRYGTLLAVLMDPANPRCSTAGRRDVSMVSDLEIRRINIEASCNVERVFKIWFDPDGGYERVCDLLSRAWAYLPMPRKTRYPGRQNYAVGNLMSRLRKLPDVNFQSIMNVQASRDSVYWPAARNRPFRALANAVILSAFRNGEIENAHAGTSHGYSLDERRFTAMEERQIMKQAAQTFGGTFGGIFPDFNDGVQDEYLRGYMDVMPVMGCATGYWSLDKTSAVVAYDGEMHEDMDMYKLVNAVQFDKSTIDPDETTKRRVPSIISASLPKSGENL